MYVLVRAKFTPAEIIGTKDVNDPEGTFYLGDQDHKFYASAADATTAGNKPLSSRIEFGTVKYPGGLCYYAVPVGQIDATLQLAPVLRNDYFYINIQSVFRIGMPNDPFNTPYQTLTNDIPYGVYIKTTITVQPWTLKTRKYVV